LITLALATAKFSADKDGAVADFKKRLPRIERAINNNISTNKKKTRAVGSKAAAKRQLLVHLVSNAAIQKLNRVWRHKNSTTDVLSFNYAESGLPFFSHETTGEVYIAFMIAKKQARQYSLPLADELSILAVHGVLHILGYDHEESAAAMKKMQNAEKKILAACGIDSTGALTHR